MFRRKLTARGRITVARKLLELQVRPDDELIFAVGGDEVVIGASPQLQTGDPFAAFIEWQSDADHAAYRDL